MAFVVNIAKGFVDATVDLVTGAADIIVDIADFAVDEIIQPVLQGVGDVVDYAMDNPIEAAAKLALLVFAPASVSAWAIPLVDGAATIAKGGDIEDGIKAAAISYAGSQVGAKVGANVGGSLAEAGYGSTVSAAISGGTKSATVALIYGQDPLQAFATGGINAGVGALLADIDTKLTNAVEGQLDEFNKPVISGWENLQDGVKDSITASLAAELDGGSISANTLSGIVTKYTGVVKTMNKFLTDNTGIEAGRAAVITSALTQAATTALAGNPEMSGEAFFARIDQYGMEELKKLADKPVQKFLDKVDGSYQATETAATALNDVITKTADAADGFNGLRTELNGKIQEQDRLRDVFTVAKAAYDANPTQETADAQNDAAGAFNVYADQLKVDYETTYKPQMDAFQATYDEFNPQIEGLQGDYDTANKYMLSDIDNLSAEMKPVFSDTERAVALALRPGIDEDAYRKATGIGEDVDVYRHYLENQKSVDNIIVSTAVGELQKTVETTENSTVLPRAEDYEINRTAPAQLDTPTMEKLYKLQSVPNLLNVGEDTVFNEKNEDFSVDYDTVTSEELDSLIKETKLGFVKSIVGQFAVGTFENLGESIKGAGVSAGVAMDEVGNRFGGWLDDLVEDAEAQVGLTVGKSGWNTTEAEFEAIAEAANKPSLSDEEKTKKAQTRRMENFDSSNSYIEQGTEYLGNFVGSVGNWIETHVFTDAEKKILADSGLEGTSFDDLGFTGDNGSLSGLAGNVSNEVGGEVLDFLMRKNPWLIAASGTLNAGEAVQGANEQAKQVVNDLFREGELQQTDLYKDALAAYATDDMYDDPKFMAVATDKVKDFIASEILRDSIVAVASVGATDILLPKASSGVVLSGLIRAGAEGTQEVAESALVLNSVNKILDTNLKIYEDAAGNFVMGGLSGGGTQVVGAVTNATKDAIVYSKAFIDGTGGTDPDGTGGTDPDGTDGSKSEAPKVDTGFAEDTWEAFDAASKIREESYKEFIKTAENWGVTEDVSNAGDLVATLQRLTTLDMDTISGIANVSYDAGITTKDEITKAAKEANPSLIYTDDIATDLYEKFGGTTNDAELSAAVADYLAPFSTAYETAKVTALTEGTDIVWDDVKVTTEIQIDADNTSESEARQMFADLGYTPTDAEVQENVGAKSEAGREEFIKAYVNPRQTTREEAIKYFSDQNYTPTEEEILARIGQGNVAFDENTQNDTKTYVKPRMTSEAEVRQAFEDQGYTPTDEEVAALVGQGDDTFADTTLGGVESYADERITTAAEVRAEFEKAGLVDVSQEDIDKFVGQLNENDQLAAVKDYVPTATTNIVKGLIGSPAIADDPDTEADESKEATGVYKSIAEGKTGDQALEAALATMDEDVDAIAQDVIGLTSDVGDIGADLTGLTGDVGGLTGDVAGLTGDVDTLQAAIGEEGVADNPDTEEDETKDPTGIFATIKAYEDSGAKRDDALQLAVDDVSAALGTTKTDLIAAIGETETTLSKEIGDVETTLTEEIGDVETTLTEEIGDVRTDLGADIDTVADFVGKPAREVTQDDVDFVIDLIAQEGVNAELTMQYDVTGDGIVDIADQNMLTSGLQGDDVTLADTSIFNPATGLYAQQEQDTQATLDAITDMNTDINTKIDTNTQQQNLRDFLKMGEQGMFKGARMSTTPAPLANIDYLYDFNSIFANPTQEGLFSSPYSTTTRNKAAAGGFAQGGQVEDENDMLLRIIEGL